MDTGFRERLKPRYVDPFNPVLTSSEALEVSIEQQEYIHKILDDACSDSMYTIKAFDSIMLVLTKGSVLVPEITSLSPANATIGSEAFDIHVHGTGFGENTKIIFNGFEEPTTVVSDTEVTTGVNMPLWQAPVVVTVQVSTRDGVVSNPMNFEFLPSTPEVLSNRDEKQLKLPFDYDLKKKK